MVDGKIFGSELDGEEACAMGSGWYNRSCAMTRLQIMLTPKVSLMKLGLLLRRIKYMRSSI